MECKILTHDYFNEYWDFLLENESTLNQHLYQWKNFYDKMSGDNYYCFLLYENSIIQASLPFVLYKCEIGNIIHSNPFHFYGGILSPLLEKEKREEVFNILCHELIEFSRFNNCISITISTPPFSNDYELYKKCLKPDFELPNFYQYINLKKDLLYGTNSKERNNIKRNLKIAAKHSLKLFSDNHIDTMKEWYRIYQKRMNDINAPVNPIDIFLNALQYFVPIDKAKFFYVSYNNKIIGGSLVIYHNKVIDIYIAAIDTNYFFTQANTYLIYYIINWAKNKGFTYLNWQSSKSRESNVYKYKASWGCEEGTHYYLTKIVGNIDELKKVPLDIIKEKYKGHYVIPYDQFKS